MPPGVRQENKPWPRCSVREHRIVSAPKKLGCELGEGYGRLREQFVDGHG